MNIELSKDEIQTILKPVRRRIFELKSSTEKAFRDNDVEKFFKEAQEKTSLMLVEKKLLKYVR